MKYNLIMWLMLFNIALAAQTLQFPTYKSPTEALSAQFNQDILPGGGTLEPVVVTQLAGATMYQGAGQFICQKAGWYVILGAFKLKNGSWAGASNLPAVWLKSNSTTIDGQYLGGASLPENWNEEAVIPLSGLVYMVPDDYFYLQIDNSSPNTFTIAGGNASMLHVKEIL